jgi:hypothetical protein
LLLFAILLALVPGLAVFLGATALFIGGVIGLALVIKVLTASDPNNAIVIGQWIASLVLIVFVLGLFAFRLKRLTAGKRAALNTPRQPRSRTANS